MGITEPHIMSWTHGRMSSTLDRGRSSMTSPGRGTHAGSRVAVGAIALASMLTPLNTSMLPVALPHVQREFGTSASASTWLLTVFALVSAVGHPLAGVLADRLGPRRVLMAGLAVAGASALAASGAETFTRLVALRAAQALGTSTAFPGRRRAAANPPCARGLRRLAPTRVARRRGDGRQSGRGVRTDARRRAH
jgi:MFS family permease